MKTLWIALSSLLLLGAGFGLLSVLNDAQLRTTALQAKAAEVAEQNGRLEAEAVKMKAALAQALTQLDQTKNRAASDLAAQRDTLAAQQQAVEKAQLEKQAGAAENQSVAMKTLAAALGDAQAQLAALQAKYDAIAGQNNRLQNQVAQMQVDFAQARDRAVRESTATLRQELADTQQALAQARDQEQRDNVVVLRQELQRTQLALAALQNGPPPGVVDSQYLVLKKTHTGATQVKTGTVVLIQPASWLVVLQGLQTGATYPAIAVTETIYNELAQGQTYAKGNLRGALP